jgi:hypothetical protein
MHMVYFRVTFLSKTVHFSHTAHMTLAVDTDIKPNLSADGRPGPWARAIGTKTKSRPDQA